MHVHTLFLNTPKLVNIIIPEMAVGMDHPFVATSFMMFLLKQESLFTTIQFNS